MTAHGRCEHPGGTATSRSGAHGAARRRREQGASPSPSPGKSEPEGSRPTPQLPRGGAGTGSPAGGRRGGGSHPGWRWPCAEPRELGGVPGSRRAVPGKEPAREGSGGRGVKGEAGGQASPAGSLAVALPRSPLPFCPGGDGSAVGDGPSRPALSPRPQAGPASGRGTGEPPVPPRGVTCEDAEPAQHLPPGSETLPPGEPRAGAAGRGGAAAAAPPGTSPQPIGRRAAPPPAGPAPRGISARPLAAGAVTRGGRGGAGRDWRSLAAAAGRERSLPSVPNSAPRAQAGPGGLPAAPAAACAAFPGRARPLCPGRGRCPAHLAGGVGAARVSRAERGLPGTAAGEPRAPSPPLAKARFLRQRRARSEDSPGKLIGRSGAVSGSRRLGRDRDELAERSSLSARSWSYRGCCRCSPQDRYCKETTKRLYQV